VKLIVLTLPPMTLATPLGLNVWSAKKQMKFLREKAKNWKEAHLVVRQAQEEKVRRKKLE
jgi:hypothetical protein